MGPPQQRGTRAKRKLELSDDKVENKRRQANTAIEVTEYKARSKRAAGNTNSNSMQVSQIGESRHNLSKTSKQAPSKAMVKDKTNSANSTKKTHKAVDKTVEIPEISGEGQSIEDNSDLGILPIDQQANQDMFETDNFAGDDIQMDIDPLDDNVTDDAEDDDEVVIKCTDTSQREEEIPTEVIKQLKANPILKQYIGDVVKATIDSVTKGK